MKKSRYGIFLATLLAILLAFGPLVGCSSQVGSASGGSQAASAAGSASADGQSTQSAGATAKTSEYADAWKPRDGYTLKKVVAVSRHNLRAPQEKDMEELSKSTTHNWISWSSNGSELTVKGGVAETIMGEFFRKWLENEKLIPQNYMPAEGEVRFYANPRQRTLATAQFFSTGLLPVANATVEYHGEYDSRDPTFMPRFGYVSGSYTDAASKEIAAQGGDKGLAGVDADLQESYDLIQEVLDYKNSPAYKAGEAKDLKVGDAKYTIELDKEPAVSGSLKTANSLSDALTLQYYEADTIADASFGKELSYEQWQKIASVKNAYGDRRYNSKLVGVDCARLLVSEVSSELGKDNLRFSFLCGHDSNQSSFLHALGVKSYDLPSTIETKTPIGGKILFEVWENASGEQFCNIRYVYATADQVRNLDLLSLTNTPASYDLEFEGISRGSNGLYALADVKKLLSDTVAAYDKLPTDYPDQSGQADQVQQLDQAA